MHYADTFTSLCEKMRGPGPAVDPVAVPPLAELIARIEAVVTRQWPRMK